MNERFLFAIAIRTIQEYTLSNIKKGCRNSALAAFPHIMVFKLMAKKSPTLKPDAFEKGDGRVCTLFDTIAKENRSEGKDEGKAEGRAEEIVETGYEFGLSESAILERLQKKLNVPFQKAQEYFNMFKKQTV